MLIIRSGKSAIAMRCAQTYLIFMIMFVPMCLRFLGILISDDHSGLLDAAAGILIGISCTGYIGLFAMVESRTIALTKEGCEITWWNFRKFYTWDEMCYRRWFDYSWYAKNNHDVYAEGVVCFSTSPIDMPWNSSGIPITMKAPMSRVCIHFFPRGYHGDMEKHGLSFAVDKETFLDFIKYIGLSIDDIGQARRVGDSKNGEDDYFIHD